MSARAGPSFAQRKGSPVRLILIGCEYAGKTTLANEIIEWIGRTMGSSRTFHDHFHDTLYSEPDHNLVGLHIEEAIYGPLYYGYAVDGDVGSPFEATTYAGQYARMKPNISNRTRSNPPLIATSPQPFCSQATRAICRGMKKPIHVHRAPLSA